MNSKLITPIIFALLLPICMAQESLPIPHGISGYVLSLQDGSQVSSGTFISINNTRSGFYYEGATGRGPDSGKFSVSVSGVDGDTVLLIARNAYQSSVKTVSLSGAMHDVNLYISTSVSANGSDSPPYFTSSPSLLAAVGSPFEYDADVLDPESSPLTYAIFSGALTATINAQTGLISWTPQLADLGIQQFVISVSDGVNTAVQSFTVAVSLSPNAQPQIQSNPPATALSGQLYQYQITASDPDGDELTYSLVQSPQGMSVSAAGLLSWSPTNAQAGSHTVQVAVSDPKGGSALQEFTIVVTSTGNHAPQIVGNPPTDIVFGTNYAYYVQGTDSDGDALTYNLTQGPAGMGIGSQTGLLVWSANATGGFPVSIEVKDSHGVSASQSFVITVSPLESSSQTTLVSGLVFGERSSPASYGTSMLIDVDGEQRMGFTGNGTLPHAYSFSVRGSHARIRAWNATHEGEREISLAPGSLQLDVIMTRLTNLSQQVQKVTVSLRRSTQDVALTQVSAEGATGSVTVLASVESDAPVVEGRQTYQVVRINASEAIPSMTATFKVSKEWINDNNIDVFSIKLLRFDGSWRDLPGARIAEDSSAYYFESVLPAPSLLAIVGDRQKIVQGAPIKTGFSVIGVVELPGGKPAKKGIALRFTNRDSGDVRSASTLPDGTFSVAIDGAVGEIVEIRIDEQRNASYSFELGSSEGSLRLVYDQARQSLVPITGALVASSSFKPQVAVSIGIGLLLAAAVLGVVLRMKRAEQKDPITVEPRPVIETKSPEPLTLPKTQESFRPLIKQPAPERQPVVKQAPPAVKSLSIRPEQFFYLHDGSMLVSLTELYIAIDKMGDELFKYHVNSERNDFANWIENVFDNKQLADKVRKCAGKEELKAALRSRGA